MNRLFLTALAAITLVGCNHVENFTLNVSSPLKVAKGPGKAETLTIAPGKYAMKLSTGSFTSKITLSQAGQSKAIEFRTKTMKELNDEFDRNSDARQVIPAAKLKQLFDVELKKVKTLIKTGAVRDVTSSCISHYETEYREVYVPGETHCSEGREHCWQRPGTNGDGASDFSCRTEPGHCHTEPGYYRTEAVSVPVYGSKTERGQDKTYRTVTQFRFIQDGAAKAAIQAEAVDATEFDVLSSSGCN